MVKKSEVVDKVFRKIKDGSILKELPDYSDLDLKGREKRFADTVIEYNKNEPPIFPKTKDIYTRLNVARIYVTRACRSLIKKDILCNFTFPQLFEVFGYYEGRKAKIHESLDIATNREINKINKKMLENLSAPNYPCFYLALVTETNVAGEKVPVFQSIFNFLPFYKTEPLSV